MRGTPPGFAGRISEGGIIPAYAGNTKDEVGHMLAFGDHPRLCGEHLTVSPTRKPYKGSSPPMRGTLAHAKMNRTIRRIIPAYAGNTMIA